MLKEITTFVPGLLDHQMLMQMIKPGTIPKEKERKI